MRLSRFHLATTREAPADAELASHKLMLRAGMIRKLASGIYTWSPLGLRVLRKVEAVVREEMNRAGAIELLMPTIQPKPGESLPLRVDFIHRVEFEEVSGHRVLIKRGP